MAAPQPVFDNRVTRLLGVGIPIANAPMGGIAGPALVSAIAEAGAIGLVPGSMGPANTRRFVRTLGETTNRPFGVNIPLSFADPAIVDALLEDGVRFVTTSAGPVAPFTARLQAAGVTVFHVVTSLEAARQAADAGVDGLVVEGSEGAGLRGQVAMMVLLPLITSQVDLPVIAAGGIADGASMAAAFALGAEGVQMGTRMLASAESMAHENLKQAVIAAAETDTLLMDHHRGRPLRVLRTKTTTAYEFATEGDAFGDLVRAVPRLYQDGDLNSGFACVGQVSGRIDQVLPAGEILRRTIAEFAAVIDRLAAAHLTAAHLTAAKSPEPQGNAEETP
jgi:enoyl-[acyl-carrier protein] reductase II